MKKTITIVLLMFFLISIQCKKNNAKDESALAQKFAKYEAAVKKNNDMKERLATLSRAEDVSLLAEEICTSPDGKTTEISKIKLADDTIGYIESKHLADSPVIFTEDTRGYVRPTIGATSDVLIPKGTLAFITSEKGSWVQVYIGKLDNKHVKDQWVETGYSSDKNLIIEAKDYETALAKLSGGDSSKGDEAKEILVRLANGTTVFSGLAKEKLGIPTTPSGKEAINEEPKSTEEDTPAGHE